MMKRRITALVTFLDGYDRYEKGKTYKVKRDKAVYFIRNGWARGGR